MGSGDRVRSVLLAPIGMEIDGGMASVARSVARVLDDEVRRGTLERVDRLSLLDSTPTSAPPARGDEWLARGSRVRFVHRLWRGYRRHRHDLVFFDHYGLARAVHLPLPGFPPARTAIFTHANELELGLGALRGRALREATFLLANSEYSAEMLRSLQPGREVHVVYLCIDPDRERAWAAAGEPDPHARREPLVVSVTRMLRAERGRKGCDTLIDAWPGVVAAHPRARLLVAGRGDDRARLADRVRAMGLTSSVSFVGYLDREALTRLYRRAAVYAMPSRGEGFGLVFAEAMWHGLPCIGTTADASGEVIRDGETGLLVPFGDADALEAALRRLLDRPETRRAMGAAGFRRVRQEFGFARFRSRLREVLAVGRG